MTVKVHAANIHDQIIAQEVLEPLIGKTPRLKAVFADLAYKKIDLKNWIKENLGRFQDGLTRVWGTASPTPPKFLVGCPVSTLGGTALRGCQKS